MELRKSARQTTCIEGLQCLRPRGGFFKRPYRKRKIGNKNRTAKQLLDGYGYKTVVDPEYHKYSNRISKIVKNYDTAYSGITTDKFFLLDVQQVYDLYNDFGDYYMARCTSKAEKNSEYYNSDIISTTKNGYYWLRTPHAESFSSQYVRAIHPNGYVFSGGADAYNTGVSPAFYLDIKSAVLSGGSGTETDPYILNSSSNCLRISLLL